MKYYLSFLLFALVTISVGCTTAPETVAKHDHHQSSKSAKAQEKPQERTVAQENLNDLSAAQIQFLLQHTSNLQTDLAGATLTDDGKIKALLSEDSLYTFAALGIGATAATIAIRAFFRNLRNLMRVAKTGALLVGASMVAGISFTYLQQKNSGEWQNFIVLTQDAFTNLWKLVANIRSNVSNEVVADQLGLETLR